MKEVNFSKKLRLLTFNDFNFVFKKPNIYVNNNIYFYSRKNKLKFSRIGIIIFKKNIKEAYKRNKIKRLIRENFRLNQYLLPYIDLVVIINNFFFNKKKFNSILNKLFYKYYYP